MKKETDGQRWSSTAKNIDRVDALTVFHDRLYAAQNPPQFWGLLLGNALISSWDGVAWSTPDSSIVTTIVRQFITYNNQLIVQADDIGGIECFVSSPRLLAWNGSAWASLLTFSTLDLYALTEYEGQLMLGGGHPCPGCLAEGAFPRSGQN